MKFLLRTGFRAYLDLGLAIGFVRATGIVLALGGVGSIATKERDAT